MKSKKNADQKKRALQKKMKTLFIISFVIISVVTIVALATPGAAQAEEAVSLNKYYRSIIIMPEDTLWDIAVENTNGSKAEINDFITEVRNTNKIDSDKLNIGMKIIIPYYAE